MINIASDPSDEQIEKFIKDDSIGRNGFLSSMMVLFCGVQSGSIINLDGDWGSGKTIFVKELEKLGNGACADVDTPNIADGLKEKFHNEYAVFYYNAWENDGYDPAESIIMSLAGSFWGRREKIADNVLAATKTLLNVLSHRVMGCDMANEKADGYIERHMEESISAQKKQEAAEALVANGLGPEKDKRLLFVIDELDRCKPEFAMRLIEIIKHYFLNGRTVVLLVTNNRELEGVIRSYYGYDFDAYGYLDKIYDLIIKLPDVSMEQYISRYCATGRKPNWVAPAFVAVAKYYKMSMREINRLDTLFKISGQYLGRSLADYDFDYYLKFVRRIVIPFVFGARISSGKDYDDMVHGRGGKLIEKICRDSDYVRGVLGELVRGSSVTVQGLYRDIFSDGDSTAAYEAKEILRNIMNLTNFVM